MKKTIFIAFSTFTFYGQLFASDLPCSSKEGPSDANSKLSDEIVNTHFIQMFNCKNSYAQDIVKARECMEKATDTAIREYPFMSKAKLEAYEAARKVPGADLNALARETWYARDNQK